MENQTSYTTEQWSGVKWGRIVDLVRRKGIVVLDDFSHPIALRFDGFHSDWVPTIVSFHVLASELDHRDLNPEEASVRCRACNVRMTFGEKEDGSDDFRVRQIAVTAHAPNGCLWVYPAGEREGQAWLQKIILCAGCARMAVKVMHGQLLNGRITQEELAAMLPRDVLPRFKRWLESNPLEDMA